MIGIILFILAALCFLCAGLNQTFFDQPPADLVAFGLLALTLGTLFGQPLVVERFNRNS